MISSIIETESFKKWFNNSKVVDKQHTPLVVYHGTVNDFSTFNTEPIGRSFSSLGETAIGAHFSEDKSIAKCYPFSIKENMTRKVMEVYLSIQNPKKYTTLVALRKDVISFYEKNGISFADLNRLQYIARFKRELIEQGYDGITYLEGAPYNIKKNKKRVWVTFYPNQIKSIHNSGEFNPNNYNISE